MRRDSIAVTILWFDPSKSRSIMDGWMLMNETIGFAVTSNLLNTLSQVFGMGLFRVIAMWYIQNIYHVCKNSINNKKSK